MSIASHLDERRREGRERDLGIKLYTVQVPAVLLHQPPGDAAFVILRYIPLIYTSNCGRQPDNDNVGFGPRVH